MDRIHRRFCLGVLTALLVFCWIVSLRRAVPKLSQPLREPQTILLVACILGLTWAGLVEMFSALHKIQPTRLLLSVCAPFGLAVVLLVIDRDGGGAIQDAFLFLAYTIALPFLLQKIWRGEWDP